MYQNIKWFNGSEYYKVKGWLLKNGFYMTTDYGFDNAEKTSGWCKFSNGVEDVILHCTMKNGKNGKLQCDKVTSYQNHIFDDGSANTNYKPLNDKRNMNVNNGNSLAEMLSKNISELIYDGLTEGWTKEPKSSIIDIISEIEQNIDRESIWYKIQRGHSSTPCEYLSDYIRDYFSVTLEQCSEILKKLEDYYHLPYFNAIQKQQYGNTIHVLAQSHGLEEIDIEHYHTMDNGVEIFKYLESSQNVYILFGDRKKVRALYDKDVKNGNAVENSLTRYGNAFYSYISYVI